MGYAILETDEVKYLENKDPDRPLSRYNKIRLLIDSNGNPIQETWDSIDLEELPTDRYTKVKPEWEHRPDLIALEFYGNLQLFWVIAYANEMTDPFAETYIDRQIRIPDLEALSNV